MTEPSATSSSAADSAVTVSIVFYDGHEDLRRCLASLSRQTLLPRKVLLVDNSRDGLLADDFSSGLPIEIIRDGRNLGFAGGNNRALRETATPFFATLNADAFPEPDWLAAMVGAARRHPEAAAFGSLQLLDENPELADGIGDQYHLSGLAWRGGHLRPVVELDLAAGPIFSPCGAAAFFRTATLQAIGGFDEDFFCYCEDLDVGFRLRLAGHECWFVPTAVVRHRVAGSTGDSYSDFAVYHGHRNLAWVYLKNMPPLLFWLFLPAHLLLNLQMIKAVSIRGQGEVICKAKFDAMAAIPAIWSKRLAIHSQGKASILKILKALDKSLLPEPWMRSPKIIFGEKWK